MRGELTHAQQKVLAFIRSRKEITLGDLTTYQSRSLDRLHRDGYIQFIKCGECLSCKSTLSDQCDKLRIRAYQ